MTRRPLLALGLFGGALVLIASTVAVGLGYLASDIEYDDDDPWPDEGDEPDWT